MARVIIFGLLLTVVGTAFGAPGTLELEALQLLDDTVQRDSGPFLGTVKYFNSSKGFGYITPDSTKDNGSPKDVFVHFSAVNTSSDDGSRILVDGDRVSFYIHQTDKGPSAANVTKLAA